MKWLSVFLGLVLAVLLSAEISRRYFSGKEKKESPDVTVVILTPEKEKSLRDEGAREERARREKEKKESPVLAAVALTPEKEKSLREEGAREERARREKEDRLLAEVRMKVEAEFAERKRELERTLSDVKKLKDTYLVSRERVGKEALDDPEEGYVMANVRLGKVRIEVSLNAYRRRRVEEIDRGPGSEDQKQTLKDEVENIINKRRAKRLDELADGEDLVRTALEEAKARRELNKDTYYTSHRRHR